LHSKVLNELDLKGHGFRWSPAEAGMFVPFPDGTSLQLWNDDDKCAAEIKRFAPGDLAGWIALGKMKAAMRDALRPDSDADIWLGDSPTREQIRERVRHIPNAAEFLFEWSMVDLVERFFKDERMQMAYLGQGVIGTNASPHDPGTAYIYFHHGSGRMDGQPGTWGYVEGGMGMLSFLLCDIANEAGAVVATGTRVAKILPGEGVILDGGDRIHAPIVVSNADPKVTRRLLGQAADPLWGDKVQSIPTDGCTVKLSLALKALPDYRCRPGNPAPHHRGQINTPLTKREWHESHRLARAGKMPTRVWTEQYFHTAYDPSVARDGLHTMSVFAQYVPHKFANGSWEDRREEVGDVVLRSIQDYVSNFPDAILHREVLGPPDIERKVGLTGGHIFQGECLPEFMWEKRLSSKTPMEGVYLCGAGTHPGGSVIGVNGRNAAMAVLRDRSL
jgi:phytoene dehydrogenase-like protein